MKNKKLTLAIAFLATLAGTIRARGYEVDWQYWNELVLPWEVTDRWEAEVKSEQVVAERFSRFEMYNLALGGRFAASDHFFLGAEYMNEFEYDGAGWGREARYSVVPAAKWNISRTKLGVRVKVELRDFQDEVYWRLRELVKIARPVRLGTLFMSPFVSDELYHNLNEQRSFQNRFKIGAAAKLGGRVELIPYYMNIAKNARNYAAWHYVHVLGTEVVVGF